MDIAREYFTPSTVVDEELLKKKEGKHDMEGGGREGGRALKPTSSSLHLTAMGRWGGGGGGGRHEKAWDWYGGLQVLCQVLLKGI